MYILGNLAKFDIPDILQTGPQTAQEISNAISIRKSHDLDTLFHGRPHRVDPEILERILRAAAAGGYLIETNDRKFGTTPQFDILTSTHPTGFKYSLQHSITDKVSSVCWDHIEDVLIDPGFHCAVNGLGMEPFAFFNQNPFEYHNFHQTMIALSQPEMGNIVGVYDFNQFHTVVDVGGSTGHFVKKVLHSFNQVSKGINFDIPHVIDGLRNEVKDEDTLKLGERYELAEGDFFQSVCSGDCFLLKHIIHDWPDEKAVAILKNVYAAMNGTGKSRALIIEHVLPSFGEKGNDWTAFLLDLQMCVLVAAKERRKDQWEELMGKAGLVVCNYIPIGRGSMHIIVVRRDIDG